MPQVAVVADPLREGDRGDHPMLAGAEGHCLIEGLYEPSKRRRNAPEYRNMLALLARQARQVA